MLHACCDHSPRPLSCLLNARPATLPPRCMTLGPVWRSVRIRAMMEALLLKLDRSWIEGLERRLFDSVSLLLARTIQVTCHAQMVGDQSRPWTGPLSRTCKQKYTLNQAARGNLVSSARGARGRLLLEAQLTVSSLPCSFGFERCTRQHLHVY